MLKVELTENYTGFKISGDYNDLDFLYDSIHYLIKGEPENEGEYLLQNHLYGFLYELRHAYQGSREAYLEENGLYDEKMKWLEFKKKDVTNNNVYYSFNYIVTELILDISIIRFFERNIDKKVNDIFNPYINMVNYFYSISLRALSEILTERKFNTLKKGILESYINDRHYIPQWFEMITVDYLSYNKKKREKEFTHTMSAIYDYLLFEDYLPFSKKIQKDCKEKNCKLDDLHYEFPENIEW